MARTVEEIKKEMTSAFIAEPEVIAKYRLDTGLSSDEQLSKASIENIWFYIVAMAHYILERLFDTLRSDINREIDNKLPHTVRWYRTKVLQFQYPGRELIPDTDKYNNTGLTNGQVEGLQTVKYCSVEDRESILLIKVAKGLPGYREKLSNNEEEALGYYVNEIKDAGVPYKIINQQADKFFCSMKIFYNPMLLTPSDKPVEGVIKEYISNLDFNGMYANVWLIDRVQSIPGVIIPHLIEVKTQRAANPECIVETNTIAESGYFIVENDSDLQINYIPYG
ncbi:MAG: hypothetical protein FWD87_11030 [Spirochaetaceae bacterium]|nr:hypothetical protein [Spirochaetaceae bacterium]